MVAWPLSGPGFVFPSPGVTPDGESFLEVNGFRAPATGDALNLSGIGYDLDKARDRPPGVTETENFHVRLLGNGEIETEREYLVPWSQTDNFTVWCKGFADNVLSPGSGGTAGQITRTIPAQDPRYYHLYADDVQLVRGEGMWIDDPNNFAIDPEGNVQMMTVVNAVNNQPEPVPVIAPTVCFVSRDGYGNVEDGEFGIVNDGMGRWRVTFRSRPYEIRNDSDNIAKSATVPGAPLEALRWCEWITLPAIQAMPLGKVAAGNLVFNDPAAPVVNPVVQAQPVPEAGVVLVQTAQIIAKLYEFPDPNWSNMDSLLGTVNLQPFYSGPGNPMYDVGNVLFINYKKERKRNVAGRVVYNVELYFAARIGLGANGWNRFPCATGQFFQARFVGAGTRAAPRGNFTYTQAALNTLWTPGPPVAYQ